MSGCIANLLLVYFYWSIGAVDYNVQCDLLCGNTGLVSAPFPSLKSMTHFTYQGQDQSYT